MDEMQLGESCGECHDGTTAFGVMECGRCHTDPPDAIVEAEPVDADSVGTAEDVPDEEDAGSG